MPVLPLNVLPTTGSRTNRQVAADVHRAVIHVEGAAGDHHVSGRQRAAGVVGPDAASGDLDIAADGGISAIDVNGRGSRHTTPAVGRRVSGKSDTGSGAIQQQTRARHKNAAAAVAGRVVRETGGGHRGRQRLNDDSAATRRSQAAWLFEKVEVPIVADAGTDAAGCRERKDQ